MNFVDSDIIGKIFVIDKDNDKKKYWNWHFQQRMQERRKKNVTLRFKKEKKMNWTAEGTEKLYQK